MSWLEPLGRVFTPYVPWITAKNAETVIFIGHTLTGIGLCALVVIGFVRWRRRA